METYSSPINIFIWTCMFNGDIYLTEETITSVIMFFVFEFTIKFGNLFSE